MNESFLINKYLKPLTKNNPGALNLNDDIFFDPKKKLAVSVDTYVEGVHFVDSNNPKKFIKKIFRSSLSDLYCKGIKPTSYFLSLALNTKQVKTKWLNDLNQILKKEQKKFSISLSGGDTTYSSKLIITVIVVGYSKNKPVFRHNCNLHDDIYVSGNIGDSFLGLNVIKKIKNFGKLNSYFTKKYYEPDLQVKFSFFLNKIASSSVDVSDGLGLNIQDLIHKKKYGALINLNNLPLSNEARSLVKNKKIKIKNIFSKGDDYQILFTSNQKNRIKIDRMSKRLKIKLTKIGIITRDKAIIFKVNKKKFTLNNEKMGYIHQFN